MQECLILEVQFVSAWDCHTECDTICCDKIHAPGMLSRCALGNPDHVSVRDLLVRYFRLKSEAGLSMNLANWACNVHSASACTWNLCHEYHDSLPLMLPATSVASLAQQHWAMHSKCFVEETSVANVIRTIEPASQWLKAMPFGMGLW